ncbi:MAG TPA: alpha/beta fold hydrolase [Acidimicrobiales bacterium]|nr:alpha/beta fold hydrolase [Acidimicrobiales bacterium]
MPNPQQPEIRRSGRSPVDESATKEALTAQETPPVREDGHPVPEDNVPGHHPEHEQDKPVARFRQRAARVVDEAHTRQHAVRERELDLGPLRFDALECGREGDELVLLLHGFPQLSSAWRPLLEELGANGYHAVAPDQRGYSPGAQPPGVGSYRLSELVDDVLRMADALGARRFHLVGHDWGGIVGWAVATTAPSRLLSLSVVSTPHPRAYLGSLLRSPQILRSGYIAFFSMPVVPELVLGSAGGTLLRRALTASGLPEDVAGQYVEELQRRRALGPALNWYRALSRSRPMVGPVEVPTLYVWSDGDTALGGAAARATARQVRGPYRFEVLHGVSHWIPETAPDELGRMVLEHLQSVGQGSGGTGRDVLTNERSAPGEASAG